MANERSVRHRLLRKIMDNNNICSQELDIKPNVTITEVEELLEKVYGFKGGSIKQLQGYDDLNYHSRPNVTSNHFVRSLWPHGYVLKIMNSQDSRNNELCEGQNALMLFLRQRGIRCTVPVETVHGHHYVKMKFPSAPTGQEIQKEHIVRLLEFQAGVILKDAPKSYRLFYGVGIFVAKLDLVLKEFSHPVYKSHYSIWHLKAVPELKFSSHFVEIPKRRELVETLTDLFTRNALTKVDSFEKGMIHGDINENNIVMEKTEDGEWQVSAVLDFGDSHESCYFFELAIALCYMMLECKKFNLDPLVGAGHFLAGYLTIWRDFSLDCGLLKLCICARMCQSLVLGLKAFKLQPENKYVLETQHIGWPLLEEFWSVPDEEVTEIWESVFKLYNVQSHSRSTSSRKN